MHFWGIEMSYKEKGQWLVGSHVFMYLVQETVSLFSSSSILPIVTSSPIVLLSRLSGPSMNPRAPEKALGPCLHEESIWVIENAVTASSLGSSPRPPIHSYLICLVLCSLLVAVQWLGRVWLFATPWVSAGRASLSFTISRSLLRLMSRAKGMESRDLALSWALPLSSWVASDSSSNCFDPLCSPL